MANLPTGIENVTADGAGNLNVNVVVGGGGGGGGNAAAGPTGSAVPASADFLGFSVTGTLTGVSAATPLPVTFSGTVDIVGHAGAVLDGTAGTPSAGVLTVQGVSGGTVIPVSGTVAATESGAWNVNQTLATPGFEAITDGTTGPAAVKAASTAAVATDKALVVALSPNTGVVQGTAAANTAGWPTTQGGLAEATAAWTSATAGNTTLQINTAGYGKVVVTLNQGTTITGGVVTFEVSDTTAFTNVYQLIGNRIDILGVTPVTQYFLVASANVPWVFDVSGWAAFRVRLSTVITGSATVNVGITASAGAEAPIVRVDSVQSITGTVTVRNSVAQSVIGDNRADINTMGDSASNSNALLVADTVYGGAFSGTAQLALQGWSKSRVATVFKTIQATASGNTAGWTPGSGNKFRLMAYRISLTDNVTFTGGGVVTVSFQDATTGIPIAYDIYVPATALTTLVGTAYDSGYVSLGVFGILSAAANNVLNVNLSGALATGNARILLAGTEE